MKTGLKFLVLSGIVLAAVKTSEAHVHAWITINPFPLVVQTQPTPPPPPGAVVPDPYAAPPPDYRDVLASFHQRAQRLQRLLDRQYNRHIISQEQYDRHANDLDSIIRDEQQDAARHGGGLTPREVNDLNHRLTDLQDRVHEDLAR